MNHNKTMAILHLDKIVMKGIMCSSCDGVLKTVINPSSTERIISVLTLGRIRLKTYECERCRKQFMMI